MTSNRGHDGGSALRCEHNIFLTTPAEDAENFKHLWLEEMKRADKAEALLERARAEIAELRRPKENRRW